MIEKMIKVSIERPVVDLPGDLVSLRPEIEAFERWMNNTNNPPLTRYERSILLTYLGWKFTDESGVGDTDT
jgi:hypothetical protein